MSNDPGLVPYEEPRNGRESMRIRARRIDADPGAQEEWDEYWEHVQEKARQRRAEAPKLPPQPPGPPPELDAEYVVTKIKELPARVDYERDLPELPPPEVRALPAPRPMEPPPRPKRKRLPPPPVDRDVEGLFLIGTALLLLVVAGVMPRNDSNG